MWLEADLTRFCEYRPGTLYWICQPGNDYWIGSGTFICVEPFTEWVLLFMYDPTEGEPDLSEETLLARAQRLIGDPEVDVRIKAVSQWQINKLVAHRFRHGRVFLTGDAAHRHPPANGLGTNTSIQDSFNLCWKLTQVLRGRAGDSLLDSYDHERQPVGATVVDRAMRSVEDMLPISQALGFRPGQSAAEGWASIDELFGPTERGARRRELDAAVALQNYQFNCHGVELDQRYASPAVVPDGNPPPEPSSDPELYHHPTTTPGAYLPHAWLQHGTGYVSTLDLAGHDRFTLLAGTGGQAWRDAADTVAAELGIDLAVITVGYREAYDDVYGDWAARREITDSGALLVRPDRHIAWRSHDLPSDPTTALRQACRSILGAPAASPSARTYETVGG